MIGWLDQEEPLRWDDARIAHARCRRILRRLADDRPYLTDLVHNVASDPELFADSEHHPVMNRLTLHREVHRGIYLRMHISPGQNELIPHDHKYGFTTFILQGSYVHVWRKRAIAAIAGPFTSGDISPGTITVERQGSCYTLFESLVHQTVMESGTVTLFMRGPERFPKSNAASDMLHLLGSWQEREKESAGSQRALSGNGPAEGSSKHTAGQRPMRADEYVALVEDLHRRGVLVGLPRNQGATDGPNGDNSE